jgi:hypothetical protein
MSDQSKAHPRLAFAPLKVPRKRIAYPGTLPFKELYADSVDGQCPLWVKSGLPSQVRFMSVLPAKADIERGWAAGRIYEYTPSSCQLSGPVPSKMQIGLGNLATPFSAVGAEVDDAPLPLAGVSLGSSRCLQNVDI